MVEKCAVMEGPALNQTGSSQVEAGETVAREKCRHRLVSTASVRVENEAMPPLSFSRTHTTLRDSPRPSLAYAFVRHSKPQSFYLLGRSNTNRDSSSLTFLQQHLTLIYVQSKFSGRFTLLACTPGHAATKHSSGPSLPRFAASVMNHGSRIVPWQRDEGARQTRNQVSTSCRITGGASRGI